MDSFVLPPTYYNFSKSANLTYKSIFHWLVVGGKDTAVGGDGVVMVRCTVQCYNVPGNVRARLGYAVLVTGSPTCHLHTTNTATPFLLR